MRGKKEHALDQGLKKQKREDLIFYIFWITLPCAIYFFGLISTNVNSLLLAFQTNKGGVITWAGFTNFRDVLYDLFNTEVLKSAFRRSATVYLISQTVNTVVPLMFSYYVYKKMPGHAFFRIVLYIPSLISGMVTVHIYRTIVDRLVPTIVEKYTGKEIMGLISNPDTAFMTSYLYGLWMGFSGGLLMNLAIMNGVDESVREAGQLDGVGFFQEFWYIVFPACYKVLLIDLVTSLPSLFSYDAGMFALFGGAGNENVYTLGYYFLIKTLGGSESMYPYLSAWSLIVSAICIPITLTGRHLVNKYGPSEE